MNEPAPLMESLVGLARASLASGNMAQAQRSVEEIFGHLTLRGTYGMDEPFQVYRTCHCVLRASRDPRAKVILETAYTLLQERAARFSHDDLRRAFLENVPGHRDLVVAWTEMRRRLNQVRRI